MNKKVIKIKYEVEIISQDKLDDIFGFVFNKIAEYEELDNSKRFSNTYNSLGDNNNE